MRWEFGETRRSSRRNCHSCSWLRGAGAIGRGVERGGEWEGKEGERKGKCKTPEKPKVWMAILA